MAMVKKSITVTYQQDEWIKARIASGAYGNDSEYFRELIRRDQARDVELETLRAALIKGEESGEPQPFDAKQFQEEMLEKHGQRAR